MTTIHGQLLGSQVLLPRDELECLMDLARKSTAIELQLVDDDVPTVAWMRFAEQGGAFDFWHDEGENIYTAQDGEPV